VSPPNAGAFHDTVKFVHPHASRDARAAVGLKDHVLEHLVIHVLLEHGGDAAQVSQRDARAVFIAVPGLLLLRGVCEEAEGLVHLCPVACTVGVVGAAVELERADGEEGFVRRVPVRLGVKDLEELPELGR
jgi:hypothetical protein